MKYLITYACDGEYISEFSNMYGIANTIGFADCNDCYDFRIYRIVKGIPELLDYNKECCPGYCAVTLYDLGGVEIDSSEYAEH